MANRYDWLLLDNDGVLIDSERYYFQATQEAFAMRGETLTHADYRQAQEAGGHVWERFSDPQVVRDTRAWRDARYQQHLSEQAIDIPGVAATLEALRSRVTMAIVSTAKPSDFEIIHASRPLRAHMALVLLNGDYPRAKPAPDPYLTAVSKLGAVPARTLAVEDSVRGMRAALAAGLDCAIVHSEFQRGEDFSGATYRLERFSELPALIAGPR